MSNTCHTQEKMLSAKQLAQFYQVSRALVSRWTKEGLPCIYIGKVKESRRGSRPRFDITQVKAWLKAQHITFKTNAKKQ